MKEEEEELNRILRLTPETLFIDADDNGLSVKDSTWNRCPFIQIYLGALRTLCRVQLTEAELSRLITKTPLSVI